MWLDNRAWHDDRLSAAGRRKQGSTRFGELLKYITFLLAATMAPLILMGSAIACEVEEPVGAQTAASDVATDLWDIAGADLPCCGTAYCLCEALCTAGHHEEASAKTPCCSKKHPSHPGHTTWPVALVQRTVEPSTAPARLPHTWMAVPTDFTEKHLPAIRPHEEQPDILLMHCTSLT